MRGSKSDNPRRLNRPAIWADYKGREVDLILTLAAGRFHIPHDDLLGWVAANTNALRTKSWTERGHYSWPRPPQKMLSFLRRYAATNGLT